MASQMPMPGPPPPGGPSPQQIQEMRAHMAAEAAKRGMTPQQFQEMQRQQLAAQAAKLGMSPEQYVNQLRMQALQQRARMQAAAAAQQGGAPPPPPGAPQPGQMPGAPPGPGAPGTPPTPQQIQQMQQMQQQMQRQMQQQGQAPPQQMQQQVPVNPNAPKDPKAIAVAKFLKSQNLKPRTCILDGQRKDMFKGMRSVAFSSTSAQSSNMDSSKTRHPRPPIPRLPKGQQQAQLPPPTRHGSRLRRKHLQTAPTLPPRAPRDQIRPARRPQPRQAQEPRQRSLDRQSRTATDHRPNGALHLALRRPTMETESHGRRRSRRNHGRYHVPSVAGHAPPGRLVPLRGLHGITGLVLRHGNFPIDTFLCNGVCGAAGIVAVSELVRGCRIL